MKHILLQAIVTLLIVSSVGAGWRKIRSGTFATMPNVARTLQPTSDTQQLFFVYSSASGKVLKELMFSNMSAQKAYFRNQGFKLGIGTTTPLAQIHVVGNSSPAIQVQSMGSGNPAVNFYYNADTAGTVPTALTSVGSTTFGWYDGTTPRVAGGVYGYTDSGVTTGATGRYSYLGFATSYGSVSNGAPTFKVIVPSQGGLQLRTATGLPCTQTNKGTFWFMSTATGSQLKACGRNSAGFYHYTTIVKW